MELTELPLPPEIWAATPRAAQALIVALQPRIRAAEARLAQLLRRGQANPHGKLAGPCREVTKWWPALWTFARVEGA